jgi:hypothetical protein
MGAGTIIEAPKRRPRRGDAALGDVRERARLEAALDEALMNTFPASDPISIEQPASRSK